MFPARSVPHSQTFLAVVQRLREKGTFRPRSVDRCQERTRWMLDLEPQILEIVEENPSISTRQLIREFQVFSLWYVALLKSKGCYAIMFSGCKHCIRRQEFCEWVIQQCVDQLDFLRIVFFADETRFTRNGIFNSHNTYIQQYKSGTTMQVLQRFGTIYLHRRA
jgi:hypothetical protein